MPMASSYRHWPSAGLVTGMVFTSDELVSVSLASATTVRPRRNIINYTTTSQFVIAHATTISHTCTYSFFDWIEASKSCT